MKRLFLALFVLVSINGYLMGQNESTSKTHDDLIHCIPQMGMDSLPILNDCESKYLNDLLFYQRGSFDFHEKKVAFFTGNIGGIPCSKENYFAVKKRAIRGNIDCTLGLHFCGWLFIFEEEDAKIVGYDAVVFDGCKKALSKKEVIKRLNKRTKRGTKWFVPKF